LSISDDFANGVLDPVWRLEGPAGTSASLGTNATDAYLSLVTPDGDYDAYGVNNASRAMQDTTDTDFQISTRFLTTPTEKYQLQGMLVEQDANNWIRFDTYSDGKKLYAYAAITIDGVTIPQINMRIPGGLAPYLRVTRVGDLWTMEYSTDGSSWIVAGSFTQALVVSAVGVHAGNTGPASGYTAEVDYFENSNDPILDEDGSIVPVNQAPVAVDDPDFTTAQDTDLVFTAATDLLANDSDPDGDAFSITGFTQPTNGTLTDNLDGTYTYTPDAGYNGEDSFTYTISDASLSDTATVSITVGTPPPPPPPSALVSDDFAGGVLDPVWRLEGPAGTSASLGTSATEAWLELVTPDGDFDLWGMNNGSRAMQDSGNGNFTVSARFLTTPTERYQLQGLLIEQDASNWVRFDTYSDGNKLYAFAAVTVGGASTAQFNVAIAGNSAPYIRVTRDGDLWTMEYSTDGNSWTVAGSFTHVLTVSAVGVFAGNIGQTTGYSAQVDYFENSDDPIVDEDGTITPVNQAPVAVDDPDFATAQDTDLVFTSATDLLANDSDPDGDAFSITSFTQPTNGTLTDNLDGTYTYTPNAGFNGEDSFTYTISDASLSDTATVSITVGTPPPPPPPSALVSDDFSGGVLDPVWRIEGPAGTSAGLAASATEAWLELVTPDGDFDLWGMNNGSRAMQDSSDGDLTVSTRFLTTPTEQYQIQGLLVEQDASNWIRFDTYSDGSKLYAFAAITVAGKSTAQFNVAIAGNSAPYIRVIRAGDLWTMEYSTDGTSWTTAGSFTHVLTVSAAGVVGGNTGPTLGYTAQVDFFENADDPIVDEDGTIAPVNQAPVAVDDPDFATAQDTDLVFTSATDLLANDSDPDGDAFSITSFTQPANGTLTDNLDGTYTYTPNAGFNGEDSFTYTISDASLSDTATVSITVGTPPPPPPPSALVSDDFAGGFIDPALWRAEGPAGTSANLGASATEAWLELVTPDGDFDVWNMNNGSRLMQDSNNGNFTVMTRFLTTPTEKYQLQGLLVEQDAANWIRFDTFSDGNKLYAFASVNIGGVSTKQFQVQIAGGTAPWLRVIRDGDLWTMEYSTDGNSWTIAGSFSRVLTVSAVGVFAGNIGPTLGYTAQVDFFESSDDLIADEDGNIQPINAAPVAADDPGFATAQDTDLVFTSATDLLANDSDPDGDAFSITSFTQPANGTLTDNLDGTYTYTPDAGFNGEDSFTYTISDASLSDSATVSITVGTPPPPPPPSALVSDDFAGGVLDPVWRAEGPPGTSAMLDVTLSEAWLELGTPDGDFDVWNVNNGSRVVQDSADGNFTVSTRFLTTPTQAFQFQGLLVEQDAANWIRFDTYSDGSTLYAFAGTTVAGVSTLQLNVAIAGNLAPYIRVIRDGDLWTMEYSVDGTSWTTAGSFTHALTVSAVGVFAGNTGGATGFTAQVDYFDNADAPIVDEDGTIIIPNDPPDPTNDAYMLAADGTIAIAANEGVLRNDVDPDGDPMSVVVETGPANGVLTLNLDGSFSYAADAGYTGDDSFTYTVSDDKGGSSSATVSLRQANTAPVLLSGTSAFTKTIVSTAMPLTHIALAADFDQDGDLDIVATSEQGDSVVWFENDGALGFTPHDIDISLESAYPASLADLDQDGDMDVLAGGYRSDEYVWYENNGAGSFIKHVIAVQDGAHSLFAVDMDGDLDLDIVTAGQDSNSISWYENDGAQNFTAREIDGASLAAKSAVPVDLDGDGDIDIITASFNDDTFAWYENDGAGNFTKQVIDSGADGAYFATYADIDGDGDLDIVTASQLDDTVAWYRNDAGVFSKVLISASANGARFVSAADIDGDGDTDVLSASVDDNTIALYVNDGSGGFSTVTVDVAAIGAYGATPVDMNGDGLTDVLGASKTDGTVSVLLQQKEQQVALTPGQSFVLDTALLQATDAEQSAAELIYTLVSTPGLGELRRDGTALALGGSFSQQDVDLGLITYVQNGSVDGLDVFELSLSDGIAPASTAAFELTIGTPPPGSPIVSDDFSNGVIDPAWSIVGPAGTSAGLVTSATEAWLELVTPDGNFDIWGVNNSSRLMQSTTDTNFQLTTKFLSNPTQQYQLQGILVEQDAANWIRFDTYSDGSALRAFAAVTLGGSSTAMLNVEIPGGVAPYIRVTRDGDSWTMEYSTNGSSWVTAGSFVQALSISSVGVFGGNTGNAAGYTAQVDFFENADAPIVDEDGTIVPVNHPPVAVDDAFVTDVDLAVNINVAADLLANDSDPNGDPINLTSFTQTANGILVDNLDGTFTYTPDTGFNGVDSFTYTISDGVLFDTADVSLTVGNPIDVWYGLDQTFASQGEGQVWINILGNVAGAVSSLTYSINGGPEQVLALGPDTRRLQYDGDFNADIAYAQLDGSAVDDIVTITATMTDSSVFTRDVTINYESGAVWSPNYSIDWATVVNLQDAVQVVDGTWSYDASGARPVDLGYDRLLVLGDQSWDNYRLEMTIAMHDLTNVDPLGRDGGGVAIGMLWNGHTDQPVSGWQPKSGYEPGATFFYETQFKSHSYNSFSQVLGSQAFTLTEGLSYNFIVQVEQTGLYDRLYSLKVWEVGTAEPAGWTLQTTEVFSIDEAPATGSIYLNAHYYDVTFGDLNVTEITGSDIIQGDAQDESLIAVDTGAALPGLAELDVFVGAGGADLFIFGDADNVFYDDGDGLTSGVADYGFAWDFVSGTDQVQLNGAVADYLLTEDAAGLPAGTSIWRVGTGGDADELIGALNGVYGLDLNSSDFVFVDTPMA
jgi:regulation of enolase protein 1 (concanavalin A-like superfamily)